MNEIINVAGLAGNVLLIIAAIAALLRKWRMSQRVRWTIIIVAALMVSIPFGQLPLAAYVRGVVGNVSIPLFLLLGISLWHNAHGQKATTTPERNIMLALAALGGIILYPLALGVGYSDPYRIGFGNTWFIALLLILALIAVYKKYFLLTAAITLAVLAWSVPLYEATNLWNYLLDPLLVIYAAAALVAQAVGALWRSKSTFNSVAN